MLLVVVSCGSEANQSSSAKPPPALARLEIGPQAVLLTPEEGEAQLTVRGYTRRDRELEPSQVEWTSSDPDVRGARRPRRQGAGARRAEGDGNSSGVRLPDPFELGSDGGLVEPPLGAAHRRCIEGLARLFDTDAVHVEEHERGKQTGTLVPVGYEPDRTGVVIDQCGAKSEWGVAVASGLPDRRRGHRWGGRF